MHIKLKPEQTYTLDGILPSADSWYIANNYTNEGVWLVVCENAVDIERIFKELSFFAPHLNVHIFADRELLPYDHFSAHADLISQRLATLYALNQNQCNIVLSAADTIAQKIAPINFIAKYTFNLQINQEFDEVSFKNQMNIAGYTHVNSVMQCGEFCIRGGVIDIFPMGVALPYRIDLFGSTIENIKVFNVDSQRSLYDVNSINLLPSKEYAFDKQAQQLFLTQFKDKFNNTSSIIYKNMVQGIAVSGIESYLPLFFEQQATSSLFDYLPKNSKIITIGDISKNLQRLWKDATHHHDFFATDVQRPLLPPQDLYLKEDEWFSLAKKFGRLSLSTKVIEKTSSKSSNDEICQVIPDIFIQHKKVDLLANFKNFCTNYKDYVIIVCAESAGRLDSLQSIFNQNKVAHEVIKQNDNLKAGIYLQHNPIHFGFILPKQNIIYISEQNLFANYVRKQNKNKATTSDIENVVKDLAELNIDDAVVHINHGIGRYKGLISIDTGQGLEDFFHIQYAKEANLYVPVQHLHLISRYAGNNPENAPLNHLGSGQWEKAKRKAAEKIYDTAAELLELYA
jgi:transcription-repair coupling factor (superfamily II helicase)